MKSYNKYLFTLTNLEDNDKWNSQIIKLNEI